MTSLTILKEFEDIVKNVNVIQLGIYTISPKVRYPCSRLQSQGISINTFFESPKSFQSRIARRCRGKDSQNEESETHQDPTKTENISKENRSQAYGFQEFNPTALKDINHGAKNSKKSNLNIQSLTIETGNGFTTQSQKEMLKTLESTNQDTKGVDNTLLQE